MAGPKTYKRRNYFIEKEFQAKFILKFCALVALAGLLTIGLLYFLAERSTTVSILNSRVAVRSTTDFLLPLLIQTTLIVTIFVSVATIILTLFISHKIAGPLYRFKKVLEALGRGDFSLDCHIRQLDQLRGLSDGLNEMIMHIRRQLKSIKGKLSDLKKEADGAGNQQLKKQVEELNQLVDYFKS